MLIEFKVENYRSFREAQTFSLVASNYVKDLESNVIGESLPGLSNTRYLKGAAIYGSNASGKSNLLEALRFMTEFVKNSATKLKPAEKTGVEPFILDASSREGASRFEVTAAIQGVRYQYGFALDEQRVIEEYLIAYPKGLAQKWFERTYDPDDDSYLWSNSTAHFKLDSALRDKTRPNSLFLSVGPQFNNEQLTVLYNWFAKELRFLNLGGDVQFSPSFTVGLMSENKEQVPRIMNLLRSADFGVTDADVETEDLSLEQVQVKYPQIVSQMEDEGSPLTGKIRVFDIRLKHRASDREDTALGFEKESAGTRRLFALAGPWLDILDRGRTVLVDELETSLHPKLVREFLALLFCEKNNPNGAQVIFTTHNPILLDNTLLRRDQVWFTEKDEGGATHLYPLTEYKPRKGESLTKGYLSGRYGALPFLPEGLKL